MVFNHCYKRYYWPFEWFSKSSVIGSFPICREVLDTSQMAKAFCVGEVFVQGDEGPVGGVAQGVHDHGVTVRHEEEKGGRRDRAGSRG